MRLVTFLLAASLLAPTAGAMAAGVDRQCVLDAVEKRNDCIDDCRDKFREQRFLCRNIDPACGNACRIGRATCMAPFLATLDACLDGCRSDLQDAKALCPTDPGPERDACIDAAQVVAFQCRDT